MNDQTRAALEAEAPVNPYSLLEAVNDSGDTSNTAWLIFLGVMTYLLVAVAGVSHRDLLLNSDIQLPILQVKIQLTHFFVFAPILLVLFHMGVVGQLVMLARKTIEFDQALRLLEPTHARSHPLRLQLHNFFFVQAIAGPDRSRVVSAFLHGMSWLTLVVLPVVLLLYVQASFVPFHEPAITWVHRVAVLADIAVLFFIGTFLMRSETSFFRAVGQTGRQHPVSSLVTTGLMMFVAVFSLFVATIPGEPLDRIGLGLLAPDRAGGDTDRRLAQSFALPFVGQIKGEGPLFGIFYRNLVVTDQDLVVDKDVTPGEASIKLRGRDLRYARLDRTDLHQADFTGANLDGASFVKADLRNATLQCVDGEQLVFTSNRSGAAGCTSARSADFSGALMSEVKASGADLRWAKLDDARLDGAELAQAALSGASLINAHLEGADLTGGVTLYGANLLLARLQGADLTGAKMMLADFSNASLQGAILAQGRLEGAVLRNVDLEGADLQVAQLQAADLTGARIAGADLRGAFVWRTLPPQRDATGLADVGAIVMRPLEDADTKAIADAMAGMDNPRIRARLGDAMAPIIASEARTWVASNDGQRWSDLQRDGATVAGETYRGRISDYLVRLACRPRFASGHVGTGIARRAASPSFRGDAAVVVDRLRSEDCPAAKTIAARALRTLASTVDTNRAP
jgi:uncharacterized protein YjbI with pentapeptide repeats